MQGLHLSYPGCILDAGCGVLGLTAGQSGCDMVYSLHTVNPAVTAIDRQAPLSQKARQLVMSRRRMLTVLSSCKLAPLSQDSLVGLLLSPSNAHPPAAICIHSALAQDVEDAAARVRPVRPGLRLRW